MYKFGTDGIRSTADDFTPEFLSKVAQGLANYAGTDIKVFLAGDTRESSEWIIHDLMVALESLGIECVSAGVLPTPAINFCFYRCDYDFAIDVTASHNPYTDNGIKIFERGKSNGIKLSPTGCKAIEDAIASSQSLPTAPFDLRDDLHQESIELYQNHLKLYIGDADFSKLKIGIDCANGATSVIKDSIFSELGAACTVINANDSYNTSINQACGSTHPESLSTLVKEQHLDLGIAFDGDGDRVIMIDETGTIVDGDEIIAIIANHLKLDKIAVTVMANQGLLNWAKSNQIATTITAVGDSNVSSAMQEENIPLGGEQSGHIILPGEPTGDGMLTALMVTKIIAKTNSTLSKQRSIIQKSPQIILNFPATPAMKSALKESPAAKSLLLDYSHKLEAISGRLLVRPSGTEPLIRITMWGDDEPTITTLANELKNHLGEIL